MNPDLMRHMKRAAFWSLCHLGVTFAVRDLLGLLHLNLASEMTPYFLFVQPATGVRVLVAWLYGWSSVLYLLPAMCVLLGFGYVTDMVALKEPLVLLGVMVSAPLAFSILKFTLGGVSQPSAMLAHWRPLLLVGFLAGMIKGSAIMLALHDVIPPSRHLFSLLQITVGSLSGTIVVLVLVMFFFRWQRFYQQWRRGSVAGDHRR
ncbi:hypothetical protein [Phaeovulum sp. W22_SRMD_FR3]|uniref:hypothetical protein n=1 Tax=Phaeovulum sp. W22_SRMD_FR3 TaxID=3240274 RepID=UPI003F950E90